MEIFFVYAGMCYAYTWSFLALATALIAFLFKPGYKAPVLFLASFFWAFMHQYGLTNTSMPKKPVIREAQVEGTIQSMPLVTESKTTFDFSMTQFEDKKVHILVRLSCFRDCKAFRKGEKWRFYLSMKRPRNLANPGSFDYSGNLNARHIHWTGFIKASKPAVLLQKPRFNLIDTLRENISKKLTSFQLDKATAGMIEAMTVGITSRIDKAQWQLFRETGTTHLMVISGSHILLIAGFFYMVVRLVWSSLPRTGLWIPSLQIASLIALIAAFCYSLLAGFAIPVQRAFFAYFLFHMRNFVSRPLTAWQSWRYAFLLILLVEPHALMFPGFYLSFLAVAILIATNVYLNCGKVLKAILIQLACLSGLLPFTLYWFSYAAINSLLANLVAIPLVGFVLVPLSLISVILMGFTSSPLLFWPVKIAVVILYQYLYWVSSFSSLNLMLYLPSIIFAIAIGLGLFILCIFPSRNTVFAALVLLTAGLMPKTLHPGRGEARVDVLDVGQGLAVVISTKNHTLIYDTGGKFFQGMDMGEMAILPYLATLKRKKIDKIVISHPDLDHRGGLTTLLKSLPVEELIVDNVPFYKMGKDCHQYSAWDWDAVHFQFYPIEKKFPGSNNHSCILKIQTRNDALLLTGDIEQIAENDLISHYKDALAATWLIVPHHGSKTSSSLAFLKTVAPAAAIISSGFENRYHFPHQPALDAYQRLNIPLWNTANCGMVSFNLDSRPYKKIEERINCFIKAQSL